MTQLRFWWSGLVVVGRRVSGQSDALFCVCLLHFPLQLVMFPGYDLDIIHEQ